MVTAEQLRAARAILRLDQKTLAKKTGLSVETIKRLERLEGPLQANSDTVRRLKLALELAGVEFVDEHEVAGVRVVPADRAAVLMDEIRHHVTIAREAAVDLADLVRDDEQLLALVPDSMKLIADYLMQDPQIVREIRRAQRRRRSKGNA
jgi:transcriptional regulator with XRE-family HTH domain